MATRSIKAWYCTLRREVLGAAAPTSVARAGGTCQQDYWNKDCGMAGAAGLGEIPSPWAPLAVPAHAALQQPSLWREEPSITFSRGR